MDNCLEVESQGIGIVLERMALLLLFALFYTLPSKEETEVGYMISMGDRLGRREKAKQGNLGLDER